ASFWRMENGDKQLVARSAEEAGQLPRLRLPPPPSPHDVHAHARMVDHHPDSSFSDAGAKGAAPVTLETPESIRAVLVGRTSGRKENMK
ncbi:MAG: hypothetical protein ACI4NA_05420, partial [Succinivibrio sp.]